MTAQRTLSALRRSVRAAGHAQRSSASCAVVSLCCLLGVALPPALAAEPAAVKATSSTKPAPKAQSGASKKAAPVEAPPEAASDEQRSAAERVYYGEYQCEFKQVVHIAASERHPAYVDLKFAKSAYLMKPVLSSTGAIRLEDVKGQTLMVQISSKSMLLNVKTGTRLVDECIGDRQRAELEAARKATATEVAEGAIVNTTSAAAKPVP